MREALEPPVFHVLSFERAGSVYRSQIQAKTRDGRILHSLPMYAPDSSDKRDSDPRMFQQEVKSLLEQGVKAIQQAYMGTTRGLP